MILAFSWVGGQEPLSCVFANNSTISQTGMPDMNQTVEMEGVCDEDLEEIEGTTTVTQNVGGINQTEHQSDCRP